MKCKNCKKKNNSHENFYPRKMIADFIEKCILILNIHTIEECTYPNREMIFSDLAISSLFVGKRSVRGDELKLT